MRYIHNTLKENRFGVIGNRTAKQIQAEIDYLQKVDTNTTNKVRATYSITK